MLADYRAKLEKFLSEELAENNLFPDLFGPGACDRKIKLINSRGCSAICRVYSEKLGKPVILEILEENERKPIDTGTLPLVRGSLALVECYGLEKRRIADRESNIVAMEYCEGGKLKNMPIGARRNSIEKSFSHLLLGLGNINARGYALRSVNILARKDGSLALREYEQGTLADGEKSVAHPPKNLSGGPVERARAGIRLLGRTLLGAFAGQGPGGAPENRGNQRDRISEELEEVKKYNPLLADALGLMCNSDLCRGPTTDDLLEYLEVRGKEPSLGNHWERLHASEIGHRELEERKRAERKVEDSSIRERRERAAEELVGLLLRISQDFIRDDDVAARLKG